jgi:hypothetical protein
MAYDQDPTIPALTVRAAANRLGFSEWGVRKAVERGELVPVVRHPIKVSAADVEALRARKQDEAIARLGVDRLARVARDVRAQLHPPVSSGAPRGHDALALIPETTKAALGMPLLHACAMPEGSGCRWCAARTASLMLRVPLRDATMASEVGLALLGRPECADHRALVRARMAELAAEVHPGGVRAPVARTGPVGASGGAVPPAPVPRAAAKPVGDDGGRDLVARRRREVQARLKAARRRGDAGHVASLQRQLQSLTADAAVVDGRAAAARKPGKLASGCACPRRASW